MSHMKLYKNNVHELRTSKVEQWKSTVHNTRRQSRLTLQFKNRNIDMKDIMEESQDETSSSPTKKPTLPVKIPPKTKKDDKRERLRRWKEDKQKRKMLEAKKRPAFILTTKIIPDKPVFLHSEGSFKLPKIPEFKVPLQVQALTKKWMNQFQGPKTRSRTGASNFPFPLPKGFASVGTATRPVVKGTGGGVEKRKPSAVVTHQPTDKAGPSGLQSQELTNTHKPVKRPGGKGKGKENLLHSPPKDSPYKLRESTVKGKDLMAFNTP